MSGLGRRGDAATIAALCERLRANISGDLF